MMYAIVHEEPPAIRRLNPGIPAGVAKIYMKEYKSPESEWAYLGISPIEKIRLPIGIFRWKMGKEGYETVLAASSIWIAGNLKEPGILLAYEITRVLDKTGGILPGMTRVQGAETPLGKLDDFYIDPAKISAAAFQAAKITEVMDFYREKPVPDSISRYTESNFPTTRRI